MEVIDIYDGYLDYFDDYFEYQDLEFYRDYEWLERDDDVGCDKVEISYRCDSRDTNLLEYIKKLFTRIKWNSRIDLKFRYISYTDDAGLKVFMECSALEGGVEGDINSCRSHNPQNPKYAQRDYIEDVVYVETHGDIYADATHDTPHHTHPRMGIVYGDCDMCDAVVSEKNVDSKLYSLKVWRCFTTRQLYKLKIALIGNNRTFACDMEKQLKPYLNIV